MFSLSVGPRCHPWAHSCISKSTVPASVTIRRTSRGHSGKRVGNRIGHVKKLQFKRKRDKLNTPGGRLTAFGYLSEVSADLFHLLPQFLDLTAQFHHGAFQLRTGRGNVARGGRAPVKIRGRRALATG
jgi:hypothetical protein